MKTIEKKLYIKKHKELETIILTSIEYIYKDVVESGVSLKLTRDLEVIINERFTELLLEKLKNIDLTLFKVLVDITEEGILTFTPNNTFTLALMNGYYVEPSHFIEKFEFLNINNGEATFYVGKPLKL